MVERRRRSLSSGLKIGKYHLRTPIRVQPDRALFSAFDPVLDRTVAIKIIQIFSPGSEEEAKATETFFSEARTIARLQHQNIVSIYDAGMGDYEGYLVMEFVHGESLLQLLKRQDKLSVEEALQISIQICHALRYAHEKNVVHRDIKPSNIMLTNEGQVKLVDFGISLLGAREKDTNPELVGTPSYMAPELLHAGSPNKKTDLFSLAVVMFEMISGKRPFAGQDAHNVMYKIINDDPAQLDRSVPEPIAKLIYKALDKDPEKRFSSAQVLEQELHNLLGVARINGDVQPSIEASQLELTDVFMDCSAEILEELASSARLVSYGNEEVVAKSKNCQANDYLYILAGEVVLNTVDADFKFGVGEWLIFDSFLANSIKFACKAQTSTRIVHVSGEHLRSTSDSARAYFYQKIVHYLIAQKI